MGGIQSVARELGICEPQAVSGAAALLPALLDGNDILGMSGKLIR
jgi:hypothetical protein